jgi:hypothetical protein
MGHSLTHSLTHSLSAANQSGKFISERKLPSGNVGHGGPTDWLQKKGEIEKAREKGRGGDGL